MIIQRSLVAGRATISANRSGFIEASISSHAFHSRTDTMTTWGDGRPYLVDGSDFMAFAPIKYIGDETTPNNYIRVDMISTAKHPVTPGY